MEPVVENNNAEEKLRIERAERRAQMRLEKQLQQQRRQVIKKYLPFGIAILCAVLVVSVLLVWGIKTKSKEVQQEPIEQNTHSAIQSQDNDNIKGAVSLGTIQMQSIPQLDSYMSQILQLIPTMYSFESTSETARINHEEILSTHTILIDESKDIIVAQNGATERINPASMSKVLTVLVAAEQIAEENLDDTFTMTLEITDYAYVNDCSSVGFLDGEKVTVRDLFYGTILPSGGDAAIGLATYVAGSHEAFVDLMNQKLKELGLADSAHFTNCIGIYDDEHYCTVYDMAVIMKAAMKNDLCREVLSAKKYTTTPTPEHPEGITISNWFLRRIEDKDTGGEVLAAKTGYVDESRFCAVSYASLRGTPYICVTVGGGSNWKCINDHVAIYTQYVPGEE